MRYFLENARVVTDGKILQGVGVLVEGGKIAALCEAAPADCARYDLLGRYLCAGLIDLHCHGGAGYEFIDGTAASVRAACALHAAHGTRVLYPTISATDFSTLCASLDAIRAVRNDLPLCVPGVHLEGPYLAPEMCGAQNTRVIKAPDAVEYTALVEKYGDLIARWSYAPERDKDGRFADFLRAHGIVGATAHSSAEYDDMRAALSHGNRLVTHLYSCTSTITRHGGFRHLGVIESAFLLDDVYVETIADGCHLPRELLAMILKIKGVERVCAVTDAIRFAGCEGGEFSGEIPYVIEDGVAKLADRSAFAGSIATADRLMQTMHRAGLSVADAVRTMTETPAAVMGLAGYGRIAEGFAASFTLLDEKLCALPEKELLSHAL